MGRPICIRARPERVQQALIIRRDLNTTRGQTIMRAMHVAMQFVAERIDRPSNGSGPAFTPTEREWLAGLRAQRLVRVHGEAALLNVIEQARKSGLSVYVGEHSSERKGATTPIPVCCAIGPAAAEDIDAIVGTLTLW